MSKFIAIQELIDRLGYSHSGLANFIELNGVYGCDADKKIYFYDVDSTGIERALVGIVFDLDNKKNFDRFGREWEDVADADLYRFQEQDPNYFYGWPEDKVPDPWDVRDEPEWIDSRYYTTSNGIYIADPRMYTIGRLLVTRKATAAEIATEIENAGIYWFDRQDRLKLITFYRSYQDCLDVLADWTDMVKNESSLNADVFNDKRLKNYGWPRGELPSFAGVRKGYGLTKEENTPATDAAEQAVSAHDNSNVDLEPEELLLSLSERQSYQAMIGGLIAFIKQKDRSVKQAHILNWINKFIKIRGLGKTNRGRLYREGDAIYKEVKQLLADHNISLLDDEPAQALKPRAK
jgi:hypothetical protein